MKFFVNYKVRKKNENGVNKRHLFINIYSLSSYRKMNVNWRWWIVN